MGKEMKLGNKLVFGGKKTHFSFDRLATDLDNQRYTITDERVIKYPSSPTGKIYTGIAKKPFIKVKKGFGFYGIVTQTDNRQFVQCHICGQWMKKIGGRHVKEHGLTTERYKKKFGLFQNTALIPDALSYELEEKSRNAMLKRFKTQKERDDWKEKITKTVRKALKVRNSHKQKFIDKDAHNNKFGYCKKQLGFALVEYIKKYKSLPTRHYKFGGDRILYALTKRHGSVNKGFEYYGLLKRYSKGVLLELVASNGKQLLYNLQHSNRNEVYNWIIENCNVLKAKENIFN